MARHCLDMFNGILLSNLLCPADVWYVFMARGVDRNKGLQTEDGGELRKKSGATFAPPFRVFVQDS